MTETKYKIYFQDRNKPTKFKEYEDVMPMIATIREQDPEVINKLAFVEQHQRRFKIDYTMGFPDIELYEAEPPKIVGIHTPEGIMVEDTDQIEMLIELVKSDYLESL